jgi:hypothetical protein
LVAPLREECRLRVFVLRRIFGLRGMRYQESGEIYIMRSLFLTRYHLPDQIEKNKMGGASSMYGYRGDAYSVLMGRPEGKRPPG